MAYLTSVNLADSSMPGRGIQLNFPRNVRVVHLQLLWINLIRDNLNPTEALFCEPPGPFQNGKVPLDKTPVREGSQPYWREIRAYLQAWGAMDWRMYNDKREPIKGKGWHLINRRGRVGHLLTNIYCAVTPQAEIDIQIRAIKHQGLSLAERLFPRALPLHRWADAEKQGSYASASARKASQSTGKQEQARPSGAGLARR